MFVLFATSDRARDTESNKIVALKKMRLDTQKDGKFILRPKPYHVYLLKFTGTKNSKTFKILNKIV